MNVEDAIYGLYELFHTADTRDESGPGIDFYRMCFNLTAAADWDGAYTGKLCRMPKADGRAGIILRDVIAENTTAGTVDVVAAATEYQDILDDRFSGCIFAHG